jgi:hypothetical protein
MSNLNLNSFSGIGTTITSNNIVSNITTGNPKYDTNCFKETITGIENYWKELIKDLETKKKDVIELNRMYSAYKAEEYQFLIDNINIKITEIEDKLSLIQKIMWDVRSRIIFSK